MEPPIRIVQTGLGPVGQMVTPYLNERKRLEIVGAVDIDPQKVGTDLGILCGLSQPIGVKISDDLDSALEGAQAAVVTTVSELDALYPLLERVVPKGIHIVSTCEELSFPWKTRPDLSEKIDSLAKAHNVSILGTGINPGFLMDFLPTAATAICRSVQKIRIQRIQDASFRRLPFRQKIGAGLSVEEFQQRVEQKKIRHVGLTESMHMVAARMGWRLDRTEDRVEPIVSETEISGKDWTVSPGIAVGVNQTGRGYVGDDEVLTLEFRAAVGQKEPADRIWIDGVPEVNLVIPGGVNGDVATCSIVANAIPVVIDAPPGLRTMVDIPPISYSS